MVRKPGQKTTGSWMITHCLFFICCLLMSGNIWAQQDVNKKSITLSKVSIAKEQRPLERLVVRNVYDVLMQIGAFDIVFGLNPQSSQKVSINLEVTTVPGEVKISDGKKSVVRRRKDRKGDVGLEVRLATIQLLLGNNYLEKNWDKLLEENRKRSQAIAKSVGLSSQSDSSDMNAGNLKNDGKNTTARDASKKYDAKGKNKNANGESDSEILEALAAGTKGIRAKDKIESVSGSVDALAGSTNENLVDSSLDENSEDRNRDKISALKNVEKINEDPISKKDNLSTAFRKQNATTSLPIEGRFTPQVKEVLPSLRKTPKVAVEEYFLRAGVNLLEGTNEDVVATSTRLDFATFGFTWRSFPIPDGETFVSKLFTEVDAEVMKAIKTDGYEVSLGKNLRGLAATQFSSSLLIGLGASYETVFLGALKGLGEGLTLQEITTYGALADIRYQGRIFKAPASLALSYGIIVLGQNKEGESYSGTVIKPRLEIKLNQEWGLNFGARLYQLNGNRGKLGTSSGSVRQLYLEGLYYF